MWPVVAARGSGAHSAGRPAPRPGGTFPGRPAPGRSARGARRWRESHRWQQSRRRGDRRGDRSVGARPPVARDTPRPVLTGRADRRPAGARAERARPLAQAPVIGLVLLLGSMASFPRSLPATYRKRDSIAILRHSIGSHRSPYPGATHRPAELPHAIPSTQRVCNPIWAGGSGRMRRRPASPGSRSPRTRGRLRRPRSARPAR
jgi:hypothetical protein